MEHRERAAELVALYFRTSVVTEDSQELVAQHLTGVVVVVAVQLSLARTQYQPAVMAARDALHQSPEPPPHLLVAAVAAVATVVAQATLLPQAA